MKFDSCTAMITGASAGIGREFARLLAPSAQCLVLVARRQQRLEQLRDELIVINSALKVEIRPTDLSDGTELSRLMDWITAENVTIDLLINNAGLGDLGSFATADPRRIEEIVLVNIKALTSLTRAVLPGMITRNRGGILNVSSSAGFLPIPRFAVYAASKAYVTSFSEALRAELCRTNVTVSTLCPGPVHTEFTEVAQGTRPRHYPSPEFVHVSAEEVARIGLEAIERDKPLVIPGGVMKFAMFLTRVTPMPVFRMLWRFGGKRG